MKNILFVFVLLGLLSCQKAPAPDYSLLTQFKWQHLEPKENTLMSEKITYSDTSSYVFNDGKYIFKSQYTLIATSGPPSYVLHRQNFTINGTWYLNADEGTLNFTFTTCDGGRPAWGIPCVETLHHSTFKILSLNKNALKLKSVGAFPETIETYSSIKK